MLFSACFAENRPKTAFAALLQAGKLWLSWWGFSESIGSRFRPTVR